MNIIFKFMFERLTATLGLPINALYEYIILAVIGAVAYGVSFRKVGDMYHSGMIWKSPEGTGMCSERERNGSHEESL